MLKNLKSIVRHWAFPLIGLSLAFYALYERKKG